ncbi:Crp/Fnr family transcriptional regulator [Spirochaetia bacterium]|nr:Crp/Fnr family transcriptional regulator [Spirochaetia bacterium]
MADLLELTLVSFQKGALIVVEGKQNADRFFIVRQGEVGVSKETEFVTDEGGRIRGPGDFFAAVSALSSHSHIESAQALTDVSLISVRRDQYGEFIHQHPTVAKKIIMDFSKRLRRLDEALSRFTLKKIVEPGLSHLFDLSEFYIRQKQYAQAYYVLRQYLKYCPQDENASLARERLGRIKAKIGLVPPEYDPRENNRLYSKGSMFFAEGEPGEELYIIQKGSVKISKVVDDQEVLIAVLRGGDIFGEMAMLEQKPRAASAVAHEDCMVTVVNRVNFTEMVQKQPQLVARLTTLQAERIWFAYKQLANALVKDPLGRMYGVLKIHLERNRVDTKNSSNYVFNFGPAELIGMAGLTQAAGREIFNKIRESKAISLVKDQIFVMNAAEIDRQVNYYKTLQKRDQNRMEYTRNSVLGKRSF